MKCDLYSLSAASLDRIGRFVDLAKLSTIPIAPSVAIIGLTYSFLEWVANTVLQQV